MMTAVTLCQDEFHSGAMKVLKHSSIHKIDDVIKSIERTTIDLVNIALNIYNEMSEHFNNTVIDSKFERVMGIISEHGFVKSCHKKYLEDLNKPEYEEIQFKNVNEAFEFYNKIITIIHNTMKELDELFLQYHSED